MKKLEPLHDYVRKRIKNDPAHDFEHVMLIVHCGLCVLRAHMSRPLGEAETTAGSAREDLKKRTAVRHGRAVGRRRLELQHVQLPSPRSLRGHCTVTFRAEDVRRHSHRRVVPQLALRCVVGVVAAHTTRDGEPRTTRVARMTAEARKRRTRAAVLAVARDLDDAAVKGRHVVPQGHWHEGQTDETAR
ncbi:MAG: hypothetical protein LV468_02280, partial [Candidatus Nitrosotenuis sp.]|nr:hypothetical protein [Candidatus Nitrosotenuis sp.]